MEQTKLNPAEVRQLFDQARVQAHMVAVETHRSASEVAQRLRETASLPTLPAGVSDLFLKLADKMAADLSNAWAILDREKSNGQ